MNFEELQIGECVEENEKNGTEYVLEDGAVTGILFKFPGVKEKIEKAVNEHG